MGIYATLRSIVGLLAHGTADTTSNRPVKVGGQARTTNPTAEADGDVVHVITDKLGKLIVMLGVPRELIATGTTTITASTSETTILAAGAAGVFHDVTTLLIANTSASDTRVDIRDATAGTVRMSLYCTSGMTTGFTLASPWPQTTSAANWTAQSSVSLTDLRIFIQANKVL